MLERQKLHVTVALDRDGSVADKYKAVAIPQTVIINRDGTVARLFVGGARASKTSSKRRSRPSSRAKSPKSRPSSQRSERESISRRAASASVD